MNRIINIIFYILAMATSTIALAVRDWQLAIWLLLLLMLTELDQIHDTLKKKNIEGSNK